MNRTFIVIIAVFLLDAPGQSVAQNAKSRSFSVAATAGVFLTASERSEKVFDGALSPVYGISFGIPVAESFDLVAGIQYLENSRDLELPIDYYPYGSSSSPSTGTASATLREWLANVGVRRLFPLSDKVTVEVGLGLSAAYVQEKLPTDLRGYSGGGERWGSYPLEELKREYSFGVAGGFGNLGLAWTPWSSPLKFVFRSQYDYLHRSAESLFEDYGGITLVAGFQYEL